MGSCRICVYEGLGCIGKTCIWHHFPEGEDEIPDYEAIKRVLGRKTFVKMLVLVKPHKLTEAMRAIIEEVHLRLKDPVGGCYGKLKEIEAQLEQLQIECHILRNKYPSPAGSSVGSSPDTDSDLQLCKSCKENLVVRGPKADNMPGSPKHKGTK